MIWPLLILFMVLPGGKNQLSSYKVTRPCDAQSISAIIAPPKLGKYEYNLLMPLPASYSHFILEFDSPLNLTCEPLAYIHTFFSLDNNTYHVETYEKSQLQNNDRVMNCLIKIPNKSPTIPYVQSIVLNQKQQLCQNPKNHYFDDIIMRKTAAASNTASVTIPNKNEKNATPQSYFDRLINQEKQFVGTNVKEEKNVVPVTVSSTMSNVKVEKNATLQSYSYFDKLINQEKEFMGINVKEEKTVVPVIVSSTMPSMKDEKTVVPVIVSSTMPSMKDEKTVVPVIVSSTMPSIKEENTVVPVIISSTMPSMKEEKNAAVQSYFDRLINQEIQFMGTNAKEEKPVMPVIVSSTISNMNKENNKDNDFKSTTIRNAVLLSIVPNVSHSEVTRPILGQTCGRQKVLQTPLIVHGQASKAGHWPWHVALNRIENFSLRYICGGTLLSKTVVLTAAHCATIRGGAIIPELLRVDLGRHDLFGHDVGQQEREVFQVIIHPRYDALTLDNDIALLKLKSEAIFTDYVQPACLWYEEAINKLPYMSIFGTVAGWGFDHQDSPSYILQQITIPLVPELTCLKSNPTFFHKQLNSNKFCAGFGNGTAVCNGDSGGGLMIFVTETPGGSTAGAWHVRGIVSVAPRRTDRNVCDPDQYTIFTDVEKYREWVLGYLN